MVQCYRRYIGSTAVLFSGTVQCLKCVTRHFDWLRIKTKQFCKLCKHCTVSNAPHECHKGMKYNTLQASSAHISSTTFSLDPSYKYGQLPLGEFVQEKFLPPKELWIERTSVDNLLLKAGNQLWMCRVCTADSKSLEMDLFQANFDNTLHLLELGSDFLSQQRHRNFVTRDEASSPSEAMQMCHLYRWHPNAHRFVFQLRKPSEGASLAPSSMARPKLTTRHMSQVASTTLRPFQPFDRFPVTDDV